MLRTFKLSRHDVHINKKHDNLEEKGPFNARGFHNSIRVLRLKGLVLFALHTGNIRKFQDYGNHGNMECHDIY